MQITFVVMFYKIKGSYHYLLYVKQMAVNTFLNKITILCYEGFCCSFFKDLN